MIKINFNNSPEITYYSQDHFVPHSRAANDWLYKTFAGFVDDLTREQMDMLAEAAIVAGFKVVRV